MTSLVVEIYLQVCKIFPEIWQASWERILLFVETKNQILLSFRVVPPEIAASNKRMTSGKTKKLPSCNTIRPGMLKCEMMKKDLQSISRFWFGGFPSRPTNSINKASANMNLQYMNLQQCGFGI